MMRTHRRERVVVGPKVESHLVNFNATARERFDRQLDDAFDAIIDGEITQPGTEGDAEVPARVSGRAQVVDAAVGKAQRVACVRTDHH